MPKRNAKPLWNVPPLVDKAVQHYADENGLSWSNALYQIAIIGYSAWVCDPENGYHHLFGDKVLADTLMDELEAQGLHGQTVTEFLMSKSLSKQGRPKAE